MNYTTVSSKVVVERIMGLLANTISQDSDRLLGNVIEWIGSKLELIGILPAMERIDETFEVCNGRVKIPCGLYLINSVAHDDQWLPYGSQTFNYDLHCTNCVNACASRDLPYSYIVNNSWLQTNVPDGECICISYVKFAVDENNFPLIPNKESVIEALFWGCLRNLMLGGFEHPNKEITYTYTDAQWYKYCGMASSDLAFMDKPKRVSFQNAWVRLFPNQLAYKQFYSNTNEDEITIQKYNNQRV